jgi:hypothetical protein
MKKVVLNQWLLGLSVVAVSFGCQSKKSMDSKPESDSQCEESYGETEDADESDDDEMSSASPSQTEEKVSMEPSHTTEVTPAEKQEEPASAPSLTEFTAPEQVSVNSTSEFDFVPEIDLEALAKMFYIDSEALSDTESVSVDSETK